jgi:DNA-directed RNA polymerase subunit RPC12/RpoP
LVLLLFGFSKNTCKTVDDDPLPLSLDALEPVVPDSEMIAGAADAIDIDPLDDMEPLQLETGELSEPVPLIEGFEQTMFEERAPKKRGQPKPKKVSTPFAHSVCPQCEAPVSTPNPPFCEACGHKLMSKKRTSDAEEGPSKRCGDCGTKNSADRGVCRNCGSRLPSLD